MPEKIKVFFTLYGTCPYCGDVNSLNTSAQYLDVDDLEHLDFECSRCDSTYYFVAEVR